MSTTPRGRFGSSILGVAAPLVALAGLTLSPGPTVAQATGSPPASPPATNPPLKPAPSTATSAPVVGEVVVTGSILHHKNVESISPLTVETSADLEKRGVTTIESAIQNLALNNSGALPNAFTANGAFATGASGASLRGLTTNSTLVLFDGLRSAYFPLADDGTRNFVDLNTIPDVIVDRVEVLQDGASSAYGADAIAGVINVITKKQFQGLTATGEGGFGQRPGADESHFTVLAGYGDMSRDGYNVYIGAEYQHDGALYNRQRGFPFDTADQSSICGTSLLGGVTCGTNMVRNGLQFDGSFQGIGTTTVPTVIAFDPATNTEIKGQVWQLLNPTAGCGAMPTITITKAEAQAGGARHVVGSTLCQQDFINDYGMISPEDTRYSLSGRATKKLGDDAKAYVEVNYYNNETYSLSSPSSIRDQATPGSAGTDYDTLNLYLPAYVCPEVVGCNASNGTVNPNDPFATIKGPSGQYEGAQIRYDFGDIPAYTRTISQVYRIAGGLDGTFGGDWKYSLGGTYAENDLRVIQAGDLYIQHLLNVVGNGSYNFVNPSQNSQSVLNYLSPTNVQDSYSRVAEVEGDLSKALVDLPGGPLQFGLGAAFRYEAVYNPSANDDINGATERWFVINPFGAIGSRTAEAAYFEFDAPIAKKLDLDVAGRYDRYSTGQSHFSPKFAAKFKPIDMITLRGTWSEGFRIPSFAEANSLPTTGFVTVNAPASFLAQHHNDGYGQAYSLGLTTVGTPGLKPETSKNLTAGIVFQPDRRFSISVDYYKITKRDVIAPADYNLAAAAYYAGTPIPAGYTVIPGLPDPNYPNAKPTIGFIEYGYANLDSLITTGLDFAATANVSLPLGVTWSSSLEVTYVNRYNVAFPDGTVQHYAGTIGPYNVTSASGTPQWRGNWENTFAFGRTTLSATVYYTSGYEEEAEDNGAIAGNCDGSAFTGTPATYVDGVTPIVCNVKAFVDVDLHASYDVTKHLQVYMNVANLLDASPPYDPTTYGGWQYNPAWAEAGIVGRYFKLGAKITF